MKTEKLGEYRVSDRRASALSWSLVVVAKGVSADTGQVGQPAQAQPLHRGGLPAHGENGKLWSRFSGQAFSFSILMQDSAGRARAAGTWTVLKVFRPCVGSG